MPALHSNTSMFLASILAGALGLSAPASGQIGGGGDPFATPDNGNDLATVSVIAERDALVPGETVWIAVHFAIEPEWHLYWKNPGDSGQPPFMEWDLPKGLTLGEARWPAPHRHVSPGDILDYIHEGELAILYPLTVSAELEGTSVTIKVAADYLICRELCLFGDGKATLNLPVASSSSKSSDADVFTRTRTRLPLEPPQASESGLDVSWSNGTLTLHAASAKEIIFYPARGKELAKPRNLIESGAAKGDTLTIKIERDAARPTVAGVVEIHAHGKVLFQEIEIHAGP